jgi:hypothetical protein
LKASYNNVNPQLAPIAAGCGGLGLNVGAVTPWMVIGIAVPGALNKPSLSRSGSSFLGQANRLSRLTVFPWDC